MLIHKSRNNNDSQSSGLAKITITIDSYEMQLYEDENYARKIGTIMETGDVKEELGEAILWYHEVKKGWFIPKTKEIRLITNYRIMKHDMETDKAIQLPLKYVDAVVMNSRSDYQSQGVGVFVGVPASISSGMGFLQRRGTSRRIGDLVFLLNGQVLLTFNNVFDPAGVKQLIYQVKKQMHGNRK